MNDAIKNHYADIRAKEQQALNNRVQIAYALSPRLEELDAVRQQTLQEVGLRILTAADGTERLHNIAREESEILALLGLPDDALKLHERCPCCHDTGYIGAAPKTPCACHLRYREMQMDESGINERETFAAFDESVYPDAQQRRRACAAKHLCENYADALPYPEKPNLLLLGMSGLGKSYLGNAIGCTAIGRGVDTVRITAYRLIQNIMADIRENSRNAPRYQTVPLLILDDLGSEPHIPNVSIEWLFAIINERTLAGRASISITNLSLLELQERYGERLMSRLCDKNTTQSLQLTGRNLRIT